MLIRFTPHFTVKGIKYLRQEYNTFDAVIYWDQYISSALYKFEGEYITKVDE